MSETPTDWFRALGVDAQAVGQVGFSLAAYADDFESPRAERADATDEDRLMLATTLTDAATLLAVVEPTAASERLAQAAAFFEAAAAPEAWVVGMASGGVWEPRQVQEGGSTIGPPSPAMSSLIRAYALQELVRENSRSGWDAGLQFNDGPSAGWTALGAPARAVSAFAVAASEGMIAEAAAALDRVIELSDETVRAAQVYDTWRWERFVSSVPLIDPELLAIGVVAARTDADLVTRMQGTDPTPARVAVLAGMRLAVDQEPPSDVGGRSQ
ncbi:hypothetical protein [Nocardioides flavescens]|uniref:Uncharacterized protein n=1 Tax=Nocardioides flavescens TaxID=2691959 RepID=A0A6L7F4A8_9ACTN|nr:hypothetical protein [Nocardioides flavescens]MXG92052.1 hypothetical protein [Nocardioides flavescens]